MSASIFSSSYQQKQPESAVRSDTGSNHDSSKNQGQTQPNSLKQNPSPVTSSVRSPAALPKIFTELETLIQTARHLDLALTQEKTKVQQYSEQLKKAHLKVRQIQFFHQEKVSTLNQQKEDALREVVHLKKRDEDLSTELLKVSDILRKAELENQRITQENKNLQMSIEGFEARVSQLKDQEKTLKTQLSQAELGNSNLQGQIEQLKHQNHELKNRLNQFQSAWKQVQAREAIYRRQFQELKSQKAEILHLKEELSQERKTRQSLEELVKKNPPHNEDLDSGIHLEF